MCKIPSFKLQVFDIKGQVIFQTTGSLKDWNGIHKVSKYSTASYVWLCSYQFEGHVVKAKMYALLVHDAVTAGKVLAELERAGISNVDIERTEYSKSAELILELKTIVMKKPKETAERLARAIGQKQAGQFISLTSIQYPTVLRDKLREF